jgi:hypothetical protein
MEVWKDIPGYEGRYQISKARRVRSLKGNGNHWIKKISTYGAQRVVYLSTGKKSERVYIDYLMSKVFGGGESGKANHNDTLLDDYSCLERIRCILEALLEIGPVLNLESAKDIAAINFQLNTALTSSTFNFKRHGGGLI